MKKIKKNPKVSVIIPLFSQMECSPSEKFPYFTYVKPIGGCIESVKMQDYKNMEILLADKKSKKGAGDIRNEAIKRAKGEIIFFICSDAILVDKDEVSKLVKVFDKTNADVVIGSSIASKDVAPLFTYLLNIEYEDRERNMGERVVDAGATTYFAIKKRVLDDVGGFPIDSTSFKVGNLLFESGFADWDFCGMLKERGYKIWHTNKVRVYHVYQTKFLSYFKKQFIQAWYRVAYLKRFRRVREGYATAKMGIQPLLFLLLPIWLLLGLVSSAIFLNLIYINLLVIFFWDIDVVLKYTKKKKDIRPLLIFPISFLRSFMWLAGIVKGAIYFLIRT